MLTLNGKQFARNNAEAVETIFAGPVTFHGFYKIKRGKGRVAVELLDMQGKRKALVSPDGCIVTAFDVQHGNKTVPHYMFGLASDTRQWLGLEAATYSQEADIGRATIQAARTEEANRLTSKPMTNKQMKNYRAISL